MYTETLQTPQAASSTGNAGYKGRTNRNRTIHWKRPQAGEQEQYVS